MSRADEIAQGLRHETGALTFALVAEEYGKGHEDFEKGLPRPADTTPSYDLGRARAARLAEEKADALVWIDAESKRRREMMRELLKDRPDVLAEYEAEMTKLDAKSPHPAKDTGQ